MNANSEVSRPDDASSPAARREAWSRYWARGAAHSCVGTYGDRYGGAIAAFWQEVFGALPATARVLDVATGNGALPRLLLDHCQEPGVQCDAIDVATVAPAWLPGLSPAQRSRLRFQGGVDAVALPFGDRLFDLVVSQYGLEYTDLERTLPEVLRVLAPGGVVALVLHHAQGRPAELAAIEIGHLEWLDRDGGYFDAVAALIEPLARARSWGGRESLQKDPQANAARERFNDLQNQLTARSGGDGADVLFDAREAVTAVFGLAGREGAPAALRALEALREEFRASAIRLRDLSAHALDERDAQALRERLAQSRGVEVSLEELRESGYRMGWTIRTRPLA